MNLPILKGIALKGWTTCEDLPNDRRGILPFPQILERVNIEAQPVYPPISLLAEKQLTLTSVRRPRQCRCDEAGEEWVRVVRLGLELRVKLRTEVEWVVRQLDNFYQTFVRRYRGNDQTCF